MGDRYNLTTLSRAPLSAAHYEENAVDERDYTGHSTCSSPGGGRCGRFSLPYAMGADVPVASTSRSGPSASRQFVQLAGNSTHFSLEVNHG